MMSVHRHDVIEDKRPTSVTLHLMLCVIRILLDKDFFKKDLRQLKHESALVLETTDPKNEEPRGQAARRAMTGKKEKRYWAETVAAADRLDTLVGLFAVVGAPKATADPFGLRRPSHAFEPLLRALRGVRECHERLFRDFLPSGKFLRGAERVHE